MSIWKSWRRATGAAIGLTLALVGWARSEIADLSASQGVVFAAGNYVAGETVVVQYTLPSESEATVTVYADLPYGFGKRWYADASTQVAQFKRPLAKGTQTFEFKLDEIKPPSAPLPQAQENMPATPLKPGDAGALPGTYVIEVLAGNDVAHVSSRLLAAGALVPASRSVPYFVGAVRDSKGNLIVADRGAWRGRRYSPTSFRLEQTYPHTALGQSADPVWCSDVAVDSKDNVYLATRNGVYKYDSNGNHSAWASDDDYLKCPYPSSIKNLLGVNLLPDAKGPTRYVYGPGAGGAGAKEYDAQEAIKLPGFAFGWGGVAIDSQDRIYVGRALPTAEVQVFEPSGKFIRRFDLPPKTDPMAMRFGKDGAMWIASADLLLRINSESGAVEKQISVGARQIHIAPDGTIYAFSGPGIARLTAAGDPLPFTSKGPQVRDEGRQLFLAIAGADPTVATPGFSSQVTGVAVTSVDDLLVSCQDGRLMRFSAAGDFLPDTPAVAFHSHETENIFIDDEPAQVDVQFTNLTEAASEVTFSATIRDIDEKILAENHATQSVPPMASLAKALNLGDAKPLGYYTIDLETRSGDRAIAATRLYGGRVVERGNTFAPYSVFGAQRMERNPEVLRRAGGGLNNNNDPVYWGEVEPKPGEWHMMPNKFAFFDARAQPQLAILGYGEPWYDGGWFKCRTASYDTFWNYCATVIAYHKGQAMIWRCWNEPNFFWHAEGPYRYEQYAILLQGTYAIGKAIDPETPMMCDGFAGSAKEMEGLAKMGAAGFTEGVPIHYPGVKTINFLDMPLEGTVESKADMVKELVAIRDQYFPGQPILNTEEGLWGVESRTPRMGAEMLPRIYISQMAVGMDRLTWFMAFSAGDSDDPTYLLRLDEDGPWPAYFAYATASRFLENAVYVGALSDGLAQIQVFAVNGKPLITAWSVEGNREFVLDAFADKVTVADWQGNQQEATTNGGKVTLQLGPSVQYISGAGTKAISDLVQRRTQELLDHAAKLDGRSSNAPGAPMSLNRLYYAARSAEIKALVPDEPKGDPAAAAKALESATAALRAKEADGRYLRNAHAALQIVRRSAFFATLDPASDYAARLAPFVIEAAKQIELNADAEKPWYPGVMLRVALDTSDLRKQTPPEQPLDEKFSPQIQKKAGETFELEMTLYNWTNAPLEGSVAPILPKGWTSTHEKFDYKVEPRKFARLTSTVSVPKDAAQAVYPIGASTIYKGAEQRELHAYRVEVSP